MQAAAEPSREEIVVGVLGRCFGEAQDFDQFCGCVEAGTKRAGGVAVLPVFLASLYDTCMQANPGDGELCGTVTKAERQRVFSGILDFEWRSSPSSEATHAASG